MHSSAESAPCCENSLTWLQTEPPVCPYHVLQLLPALLRQLVCSLSERDSCPPDIEWVHLHLQTIAAIDKFNATCGQSNGTPELPGQQGLHPVQQQCLLRPLWPDGAQLLQCYTSAHMLSWKLHGSILWSVRNTPHQRAPQVASGAHHTPVTAAA